MIRSEFLKLKRSALPYICVIAAVIMPLIFCMNLSSDPEDIQSIKKDPWNLIIVECWKGMNFLILPLFVILISTLVAQLEHRNNTWKQVHAAPIPSLKIFLAKFLVIQILIAVVMILFNVANVSMPMLLHLVRPEIDIYHTLPDWQKIAEITYQTYFAVIGISAIQFFLGMQFKNVIVPIALGFGLWLILPIAAEMNWVHLNKFPYAFSALVIFPKYASIIPYVLLGSVAYAIAFFSLTYWSFLRRKIKI